MADDTLPTYLPTLGNQHSGLARQEKGQGTHYRMATGSLLVLLPLPHILIHSWRSRSISQVQVPGALGSLDGTVVDFVEFFHDVNAQICKQRNNEREDFRRVPEYVIDNFFDTVYDNPVPDWAYPITPEEALFLIGK